MWAACVIQVTEVRLVINKNVHQVLIPWMDTVTKLVVIVQDAVCVIILKEHAVVFLVFMDPNVNIKPHCTNIACVYLFFLISLTFYYLCICIKKGSSHM